MTEMTIPMLRRKCHSHRLDIHRQSLFIDGCFHCQFDENYPRELNGILSEEEFVRSIESMNASSRLSSLQKLSVFLSILILLIGLTLSILGGILQETLHEKKYFVLVGCGVLMIIGGSLFYLFVYLKINENRSVRMNRQIEFESMKYSHRTGQSLRWMLKQTPSTSKSHRHEHFNFIDYQV
jgi:hypothetical protein